MSDTFEIGGFDEAVLIVRSPEPHLACRPVPGHQLGLLSARERILALSRGRGRLDTEVRDGRYVATIHLPLDGN